MGKKSKNKSKNAEGGAENANPGRPQTEPSKSNTKDKDDLASALQRTHVSETKVGEHSGQAQAGKEQKEWKNQKKGQQQTSQDDNKTHSQQPQATGGQQQSQGGRGQQQHQPQSSWGQQQPQGGSGQQQQQPQAAWGQQQSQGGSGQQQQKPQAAWGQQQPQGGRGQQQHQPQSSSGQQQSQGGRGNRQQQQSQSSWGQQQPQGGRGQQQHQPQSSWGQQQSEGGRGNRQQQQSQSSWGQQQPQGGRGQQQHQPQSSWGQQQSEGGRGNRQQQQSQSSWGQQQPQGGRGQQQHQPQAAGDQQHSQGGRGQTTQSRQQQLQPSSRSQSQSSVASGSSGTTQVAVWQPSSNSLNVLQRSNAHGTKGRKIRVETNYLRINLNKLIPYAYHYDIRFEPDKPKKLLPFIFQQFRETNFKNIHMAFDGQNSVYSPQDLNLQQPMEMELVHKCFDTQKDRTFKIKFKATDTLKINLGSLTKASDARAAQCLEVVFRMPSRLSTEFVHVGRSFYSQPQNIIDLGEGYELWIGLYQSLVMGTNAYLNVDVANKGFPQGCPVSSINLKDRDFYRGLDTYLKGLNLRYDVTGQIHRYNGLKDSAKQQVFVYEGQKMTVEEYYHKVKGIRLKNPDDRCLHVGNEIKNIYIPMELLSVQKGQAIKRKLNEIQTRNMIRESATSTEVRKKKIMDQLSKARHNTNPCVKAFGVDIGTQFEEIDARILDAPSLTYKENREIQPMRGVWRPDQLKFIDGRRVEVWGFLNLDDRCRDNDVFEFAKMIVSNGKALSMDFNPHHEYEKLNSYRAIDSDYDAKMDRLKKMKIELLVVVIPSFGTEVYPKVKQAAELRCGILTQCVKSQNISKKDRSTVNNILLKVNAKLNGMNHKISQKNTPPILQDTMLVGGDVTHPAPGGREPSVVGVAATHDVDSFKYNIAWRLQPPTQEMITDFKSIMTEMLRYYFSKRNAYPKKIIYYRDGVSDGQFREVLDIELKAMHAACAQINPSYKPMITFLVVMKRHHTRFFPTGKGPAEGKHNNVMPGTIVDKEITDPKHCQFFLCSHASIQGVAKPARYCLLHDDSNINVDDLQALTYNLCHLFTRCNRTVSYVAPTYYAHHAAARGKVYITGQNINLSKLDMEYKNRTIKDEIVHGHPMFFV